MTCACSRWCGRRASSRAPSKTRRQPDAQSRHLHHPAAGRPAARLTRPPLPKQSQELPGGDELLEPKPDHGEESYIGNGPAGWSGDYPGASIINVSSIEATQPSPSLLAHATTKGALVTYSKALSAMLAPRGIRVNVVAPGPVWTPLVAATSDSKGLTEFGGSSPLGRPAQPAELAGAFVFLASPAATYITGAVIAAAAVGSISRIGRWR